VPPAVRATLIWLALAPLWTAHAAPGATSAPTSAGVLPSRRADAPALRARVERLARALGLVETNAAPSFALSPVAQRAEELTVNGRLDEAAALLDVAIDEGTRAPLRVADPTALVRAAVARASIGLARGEQERAEALLARLLRYDPTFRLDPGEDTPRMRSALERVRMRLGAAPALARDDLGERCAGESLLMARRLDATTIEYARFVGCRPLVRAALHDDTPEAELVAALSVATDRAPAATTTAVEATPARRDRPVYRRAWFWVVTVGGAVPLAGVGVGIWAATRNGGGSAMAGTSWDVTPRF